LVKTGLLLNPDTEKKNSDVLAADHVPTGVQGNFPDRNPNRSFVMSHYPKG
jgi:hypothetical protein